MLTAMADEFGGPIPVGPFALIGGEDIGRAVVQTLSGHRSPAVLCAATACSASARARARRSRPRSCARTSRGRSTSHARFGEVTPLEQGDIDSLYERYQNVYGQH